MRLYTVQPTGFWEQCRSAGVIIPDPALSPHLDCVQFMMAYEWMRLQMRKRLPSYSGACPVWAWHQRPDLRTMVTSNADDRDHVLLTLEISEDRILLSDFSLWHYVLNLMYLESPGEEYDMDKEYSLSEKVRSWENVFILDHPEAGGRAQACVDCVYVHEVVAVRPFRMKYVNLEKKR